MGKCAEKTAKDLNLTREANDEFTFRSYENYLAAEKKGIFKREIVEVVTDERKGIKVDRDEEPFKYRKDKIPSLKPAFTKDGVNTPANSSKINDGACSIVLASEEALKKFNLTPLARIVSYADAEVEPIDFCIGPQ